MNFFRLLHPNGLELVADPIIEAIAKLEFEDCLRTGFYLEAPDAFVLTTPRLGSIPSPPWVNVGPVDCVGAIKILLSD